MEVKSRAIIPLHGANRREPISGLSVLLAVSESFSRPRKR